MRRSTDGKLVIDKHNAMTDKAIGANIDQLANKAVALNFAPRPDSNGALNLDKRPYKTSIADRALVKIDRLYHSYVSAKMHVSDSNVARFNFLIRIPSHQNYPLTGDPAGNVPV